MNKPAIKAALKHYDVARGEDLLWYYALSRREAVEASRDARPNTDTNLLTEVRLSRLVDVPQGEENPYDFIRRTFKFDLEGYVPDAQLAQRYYDAGLYFLQWDAPKVAERIVKQLESRNESLARALRYEYWLYQERVPQAAELYGQHETWSDRVNARHSAISAALGDFGSAERATARIGDAAQREIARARLLFYRGEYRRLSAMQSDVPEARKWILLGLAQSDLKRAGAELEKMKLDAKHDLPLLRVMAAYHGAQRDAEGLDRYARMLSTEIEDSVRRLVDLAWDAIEEKDSDRVAYLVGRIAALDADAKALPKLNARLALLREKANGAASASAVE
jgi:hypothetical protein